MLLVKNALDEPWLLFPGLAMPSNPEVHGSAFGLGPYIRIAYALDDVSLRRACEAIRTFCNSCVNHFPFP